MATSEDLIKEMLLDDPMISGILTGGVYTFEETNNNGLDPENEATAAAFEGGFLKPSAVIKSRSLIANTMGWIGNEGPAGTTEHIEIYLYDAAHWDTINPLRDLISHYLQRKPVGELGILRYQGRPIRDRDPELSDAAFIRIEFDMPGIFNPAEEDDD